MRTLARLFDGRVIAASAFLLLPSGPGYAQAQEDSNETATWIEEVQVVGTRITRRDYASPSPVYTVSRESLDLQGLPTLESALNRLPQFSPSYGRTNNYSDFGESTVNLRGLGADRNLVLLDGARLGPSGANGVINVNTLPTAMVERVEVLTGGASAVYGSDAMSGVVNIVTRRDFEGLELSGNYDISDEGDADVWSLNVAGGLPFADRRGNVSGFLDYYQRDPLQASERGFSSVPLWDDLDTGQLIAGGNANVPAGYIQNEAFIDGDFNEVIFNDDGTPRAYVWANDSYNYAPYDQLQGSLERLSGRLTIDYQLSNSLRARFEFLGSHFEDEQQIAPAAAAAWIETNLDNPVLTPETRQLFADNYEDYDDGLAVLLFRRRFEEFGPRVIDYERDNWRAGVELDGMLLGDWAWQFSYHYSEQTFDSDFSGGASLPRLQQALLVDPDTGQCFDTSDGCVPADVFGAGRLSPEALAFLRAPSAGNESEMTAHLFSFVVEGDLDIGLSEPTAFAVGVDLRNEDGSYQPDPVLFTGDIFGYWLIDAVDGDYDMAEVYVETYVPLLRDARFARELSLEVGLRYSDHSVIDDIWTWKTGLSWTPFDALRFRAMFQHAVRAPNLEELYTVTSDVTEQAGVDPFEVDDPCTASADPLGNGYQDLCVAQGIPAEQVGSWEADYLALRTYVDGGNQDLDPEAADTWTVGLIWQPDQLEGLSLALDWYQIEIEDAIQWMDSIDALYTCFDVGRSDSEFCNSFERAADGNIERLTGTYRNLAKIDTQGMDLQIEYEFAAPVSLPGRMQLALIANWNRETSFQADSLSPEYRCAGLFGSPCNQTSLGTLPEYRTMSTLSYDLGAFSAELVWHWIDDMENAALHHSVWWFEPAIDSLAVDKIDSTSYFDLHTSWQISERFRLTAGVSNLTDEDPPILGRQSFFANTDPSMYDTLGRRYHLSMNWRL